MVKKNKIPKKFYSKICKNIPILCVDIIIKNKNKFLLVKRVNEPLKNKWWLVGGRIKINENAIVAAKRKLYEEINLKAQKFKFVGFFEKKFNKSNFYKNSPYHTVSLVFICNINKPKKIILDKQSYKWKLFKKLPNIFLKNFYIK